jgi:CheY-like chemotaxis protein
VAQKTVLYIEDNFHNRRIVRKILQSRGYIVVEAEDGVKGLEMVRELRPPLILLDIGLPRMDGLEVVGRIKADTDLCTIPVIALTASAMRGDRERFLAAGCDDYLSKPIQARELIDMVASHYPPDGAMRRPEAPPEPETKEAETARVETQDKPDKGQERSASQVPMVLVVEDNPEHVNLVRRVLVAYGYEVRVAADAKGGLQDAVSHRPDIILLDLGLPDVDGQTLLGQMRRVPELADVPVVAVTAWPRSVAPRMVAAYGFDGYISKPIRFTTLGDQVAAYLSSDGV